MPALPRTTKRCAGLMSKLVTSGDAFPLAAPEPAPPVLEAAPPSDLPVGGTAASPKARPALLLLSVMALAAALPRQHGVVRRVQAVESS